MGSDGTREGPPTNPVAVAASTVALAAFPFVLVGIHVFGVADGDQLVMQEIIGYLDVGSVLFSLATKMFSVLGVFLVPALLLAWPVMAPRRFVRFRGNEVRGVLVGWVLGLAAVAGVALLAVADRSVYSVGSGTVTVLDVAGLVVVLVALVVVRARDRSWFRRRVTTTGRIAGAREAYLERAGRRSVVVSLAVAIVLVLGFAVVAFVLPPATPVEALELRGAPGWVEGYVIGSDDTQLLLLTYDQDGLKRIVNVADDDIERRVTCSRRTYENTVLTRALRSGREWDAVGCLR